MELLRPPKLGAGSARPSSLHTTLKLAWSCRDCFPQELKKKNWVSPPSKQPRSSMLFFSMLNSLAFRPTFASLKVPRVLCSLIYKRYKVMTLT